MEKLGSGINIPDPLLIFPEEFAVTGGFVVEYVSRFCCFGIGQDLC